MIKYIFPCLKCLPEGDENTEGSSSTAPSSTASPILSGEIASPFYPNLYPNNKVVTLRSTLKQPHPNYKVDQWTIEVPEGKRVKLEWAGMDIEETPGCWFDFVEVVLAL